MLGIYELPLVDNTISIYKYDSLDVMHIVILYDNISFRKLYAEHRIGQPYIESTN